VTSRWFFAAERSIDGPPMSDVLDGFLEGDAGLRDRLRGKG